MKHDPIFFGTGIAIVIKGKMPISTNKPIIDSFSNTKIAKFWQSFYFKSYFPGDQNGKRIR